MSRGKILLGAAIMVLAMAAPAFAEFASWPNPFPPEPHWGDFDEGHTWHDAAWWWQNRATWVRAHHPEWWGDFYEGVWYPAAWWWLFQCPSGGSTAMSVNSAATTVIASKLSRCQ